MSTLYLLYLYMKNNNNGSRYANRDLVVSHINLYSNNQFYSIEFKLERNGVVWEGVGETHVAQKCIKYFGVSVKWIFSCRIPGNLWPILQKNKYQWLSNSTNPFSHVFYWKSVWSSSVSIFNQYTWISSTNCLSDAWNYWNFIVFYMFFLLIRLKPYACMHT